MSVRDTTSTVSPGFSPESSGDWTELETQALRVFANLLESRAPKVPENLRPIFDELGLSVSFEKLKLPENAEAKKLLEQLIRSRLETPQGDGGIPQGDGRLKLLGMLGNSLLLAGAGTGNPLLSAIGSAIVMLAEWLAGQHGENSLQNLFQLDFFQNPKPRLQPAHGRAQPLNPTSMLSALSPYKQIA